MTLQFGTDGVRARALTDLTPDAVTTLGAAAATVLTGEHWLIGRDTRESGPVLSEAFVAGLHLAGVSVSDLGVIPTPALALLSQLFDRPAAMITASHNPWQDNGVKIFGAGGLKLDDETERRIEQQWHHPGADAAAGSSRTTALADQMPDAVTRYADHLLAMFPADCLQGMRIVLDCANGAMSVVAGAVVQALGADTVIINASPDGRNINAACGATHPGPVAAAVVQSNADLGLAFDGDGDRVIAVDNLGNVIDGDRLIALGAMQLRDQDRLHDLTVVVTVMSNLGFHKAMHAAGISVVTTAVGDRYVLEALDAGHFSIGGEQSGHLIYRDVATTGDGLLAGIRLAAYVRQTGRCSHELADQVMTSYPQVLINVQVADRHPNIAEEFAAEVTEAEAELGGEGRVLLRASGTEPLIRVMVEATTQSIAESVGNRLADLVRARLG